MALHLAVLAALRPGPWGWLAGLGYALAVCAVLAAGLARSGAVSFGQANLVTLFRSALVGGVTALVAEASPVPLLVVVAAVALAMDFVDGQVARRTSSASRLGARFDMEIDAFLLLVLSVHVAMTLGPWVVAIGGWRYAYVAAAGLARPLRRPLPPSTARKTVAAIQGLVLVVAASDLLPCVPAVAVTAAAASLLTLSFLRDIRWQLRHRPP
jgi:phosphatidylglycerophosphate synthase